MNKISTQFYLKDKTDTQLKQELKQYFLDTYQKYENLFKLLRDKKSMYEQPNKLRHPLVFYYGHSACFFINKMLLCGLINKRVNSKFERMFDIGVDEMKWDDLNQENYKYPQINEVQKYRNDVKNVVLDVIENLNIQLPINQTSDMWVILMAIEHENIHIETSSVLLRELCISHIQSSEHFKPYIDDEKSNSYPKNSLIDVSGFDMSLGSDKNNIETYGWDNEYGRHNNEIQDFKASKYLVSNGEFLEFVNDKGYFTKEYWCQEGIAWLENQQYTLPHFWQKKDDLYYLRELTRIIPLPLNHPVEVNYYEASAFCVYKSKRDSVDIELPSEDEYNCLQQSCNALDSKANTNFIYSSTVSVDKYKFGDFYDIRGNVWQWCNSPIYPFDGFESHKAYDDFSIPTFDDKHFIIKGSSFASMGNLTSMKSRYAFRKYFFQHCGFRYVQSKNISSSIKNNNIYESSTLVEQYCEFHYGREYFNVENFMKKSVDILNNIIKQYNIKTNKVMDLGCSVGRASFELANIFDEVVGIDFSTNFINTAIQICENKKISFSCIEEGDIKSSHKVSLSDLNLSSLKGKIQFLQGDACNLKDIHYGFDVIFCSNLIDRLYDPYIFLQSIKQRVNRGGLLVILSPYTWLEEYTPKDKWLGGYINNNKNIYAIDTMKEILSDFKLVHSCDVEFVIKETNRKYQHSISNLSIFLRNRG